MSTMSDPFEQRREQMFPKLTASQVARIERHGSHRRIRRGDILIEQGAHDVSFYVVLSGSIDIVRPVDGGEAPITVHEPREFTGETSLLAGRSSLIRARAAEDGELLELNAAGLRA